MIDRPLPYDTETLTALKGQAKKALRKRLRALRSSLPEGARASRSAAITQRIIALPQWASARTVALYISMGDEIQTHALIEAARSTHKRIALPVTELGAPLTFRLGFDADRELPRELSAFGVEEPTINCPLVAHEALDLVLVPALAADLRGYRIGYGAGCYDRTLPLCTNATTVIAVFDLQLIGEVPNEPHDVAAQWIVTDQRSFNVSSSPSENQ